MDAKGRRTVFAVGCCGIIGVGKSSALKRFERTGVLQRLFDEAWAPRQAPLVCFAREPSREWRDKGWLQAYYADQDGEAACFQLLVYDSHVRNIEAVLEAAAAVAAPPDRDIVLVQERTMYDQRLFWEQQVELGFRTAANPRYDAAYQAHWRRWRRFVPEPRVLLFLQTSDIQTTMQRVKARARAEELGSSLSETDLVSGEAGNEPITNVGGVTAEYQRKLLDLHQDWFAAPRAHPPGAPAEGIPCVHVNVDGPFHVDDTHLERFARQVVGIVAEMWDSAVAADAVTK